MGSDREKFENMNTMDLLSHSIKFIEHQNVPGTVLFAGNTAWIRHEVFMKFTF